MGGTTKAGCEDTAEIGESGVPPSEVGLSGTFNFLRQTCVGCTFALAGSVLRFNLDMPLLMFKALLDRRVVSPAAILCPSCGAGFQFFRREPNPETRGERVVHRVGKIQVVA